MHWLALKFHKELIQQLINMSKIANDSFAVDQVIDEAADTLNKKHKLQKI